MENQHLISKTLYEKKNKVKSLTKNFYVDYIWVPGVKWNILLKWIVAYFFFHFLMWLLENFKLRLWAHITFLLNHAVTLDPGLVLTSLQLQGEAPLIQDTWVLSVLFAHKMQAWGQD